MTLTRIDLAAEDIFLTEPLGFMGDPAVLEGYSAPYIYFERDGHVLAQMNAVKCDGDKIVKNFGNEWPSFFEIDAPHVNVYGHLLAAAPRLFGALLDAQVCMAARIADGSATDAERTAYDDAQIAIDAAQRGTFTIAATQEGV